MLYNFVLQCKHFLKGRMKMEQGRAMLRSRLRSIVLGQGYLAKAMDLLSQVQELALLCYRAEGLLLYLPLFLVK